METSKPVKIILAIVIPVIVALVFRYLFDIEWNDLFAVMTVTFFISLPYLVGVLTIYLSSLDNVRSRSYRIFFPWLPILGFMVITVLFSIEGWACWIMILPVFMLFASAGGLTAGYFRLRKSDKHSKIHLSLVFVLPFLLAPVEKIIGAIPGFYDAYTFIDIEAPADQIWRNVTRVREIRQQEDHGTVTRFLQIPRPIRAELDFEGVGARREAIFAGGLIFDERVLTYEHQKSMTFSINANTYSIPSITFDEHVLIGGDYFDVLTGEYRLEKIANDRYRLHLQSEFKLSTTFNFYASIWGRWIMKDIQQNILEVIKRRAEE